MERDPERWALVLGASSGIGRACAHRLAQDGACIAGVHLDPAERLDELDEWVREVESPGVRVRLFNENAASDNARRAVISEIRDMVLPAGGIRVLVHSLAFGSLLPLIRMEPGEEVIARKQMEMTLSVMAHSLVYWVQDLFEAQLLLPGGKIYALTSAGSTRASRNYGAVSAAKCALESHVRQLALELAPHGVSVNAIRAGVTHTPSLLRIPEHAELLERARRYNPHGRLTAPEDVGEAIAAMASSPSSWVTGNVIGVDGGEILTT